MSESPQIKWKVDDKNGMTGTVMHHRWVYGISPRKGQTCMLAMIPLTGGRTEHIICSKKSEAMSIAEKHYQFTLSEQSKE